MDDPEEKPVHDEPNPPVDPNANTAMDLVIDETVAKLLQEYDMDGNGSFDKEEGQKFIRTILASVDPNYVVSEEEMEHAFNEFDIDQNGSISITELVHYIKKML